jgi:hypothetical protein
MGFFKRDKFSSDIGSIICVYSIRDRGKLKQQIT